MLVVRHGFEFLGLEENRFSIHVSLSLMRSLYPPNTFFISMSVYSAMFGLKDAVVRNHNKEKTNNLQYLRTNIHQLKNDFTFFIIFLHFKLCCGDSKIDIDLKFPFHIALIANKQLVSSKKAAGYRRTRLEATPAALVV